MSSRRRSRPRYGRIASLASSVLVTGVALLGGVGALPSAAGEAGSAEPIRAEAAQPVAVLVDETLPAPSTDAGAGAGGTSGSPDSSEQRIEPSRDTALPKQSGAGRRVVFSEGRQRVWLVGSGDRVRRTYPVSGSIYDNLDPGTFEVYSRSEQAWGIDDSGTMKYFVRFAHGDRAAIGFHDIPIHDGELVQSLAQLGTPLSHGCIRQRRPDAVALWKFAPLGTTVVVTA